MRSASDQLKICSNQSETLPRSGWWRVISMEFLHSSLRRHFSGGCFLRLLKLPQMRHCLVIISQDEVACKLPFHSVIARVFKDYCIFCRSTPCPVQCVLWDKSSWWQVWPESCSVFAASQSYLWCGKKLLVSLRNRTAERRGRQNACVWQTWQDYYLRFLSWSSLTLMFSGLLQKVLFKGLCSLAKFFFKKD